MRGERRTLILERRVRRRSSEGSRINSAIIITWDVFGSEVLTPLENSQKEACTSGLCSHSWWVRAHKVRLHQRSQAVKTSVVPYLQSQASTERIQCHSSLPTSTDDEEDSYCVNSDPESSHDETGSLAES